MKLEKLEAFYKIHSKFYDLTRKFFLLDRKKAIESLNVSSTDLIYDFACGTGLNLHLLNQMGFTHMVGIDYSESMLQQARKKLPNIQFIQGDIETYKFENKADKIICTYSLSMTKNWQGVLKNMKQNIKSTGSIVILDFHPWMSFASVFYPIFRWWLKLHGVEPNQQVVKFLKEHFVSVEEKVMHCGYNYIVKATSPNTL